jgi:hypothetical protein
MHPPHPSDPAAAFLPDVAGDLDTIQDQLTEAVAWGLRKWRGRLPADHQEFVVCVVQQVASVLRHDSFGELLRGLILMHVAQERAEAVLHTIALILDRDNPALTADCIAYAAGLHGIQRAQLLEGAVVDAPSESELAYKHGVERAAVSKRVIECIHALNLRPSRGMKDTEAQETYAERAHQVHGTERDPAAASRKKTRTVIAAIDRVCQWGTGIDLAWLRSQPELLAQIKRAFARLQPICQSIALL